MRIFCLLLFCELFSLGAGAQNKTYIDSIHAYQQKYVKEHGVVKGKDKELLHFFPVSKEYYINARFERVYSYNWFDMETSGKRKQSYRVYGVLHFKLGDSSLKLQVYQSKDLMNTKEYADYLFIPFTDKTCGDESYENGRYLELRLGDVSTGRCILDFNKAYNPYCAYVSNVYNCPIPPKENDLPVAVKAGEMKYGKPH